MLVQIATKKNLSEFEASTEIVAKSVRAALGRTIKFLEAIAAKELSEDLRIGLNIARSRLRTFRNRGNNTLSGSLHSIPAILTGKPMPMGQGLQVGSRYFRGGFVASSKISEKLPKRVFHRKGKTRQPIVEDRIQIDEKMNETFRIVAGMAFDYFEKRFEHELKFRIKAGL